MCAIEIILSYSSKKIFIKMNTLTASNEELKEEEIFEKEKIND